MDEHTLTRFMSMIDVNPDGCWPWRDTSCRKDGYGDFTLNGKHRLAHAISYLHFNGEVPDGLELDHLCHTRDPMCAGGYSCQHRRCVNPAHLEAVSQRVNWLRGRSISAAKYAQTECDHGHPLDLVNTYFAPGGGRECRTCRAERSKRWVDEHHPGVRHGTETHCPQSHPYAGANLIITVNGGRACRECKRAWDREYMRAKRAKARKQAM